MKLLNNNKTCLNKLEKPQARLPQRKQSRTYHVRSMVWQIIGPVSNVHRRFHVDGVAYFPHAGGYQQEMHVGLQTPLGCMLANWHFGAVFLKFLPKP